MDNLSLTQQSYLPAIMWLVNPSTDLRCTGRTRLLAYAFIATAIDNKGKDIPLFDHLTHPTSVLGVYREIKLLMVSDEFKLFKLKINVSMKTLICEV